MILSEVNQRKYEATSTPFGINDCTNKGKNYNNDVDALNAKPLQLLNNTKLKLTH